jgi:hypothetical protein
MNNKLSKKIRKSINKKVRSDMEDLARTLSEAQLWWRVIYAVRIILRWHPKVKFVSRKG